MTTEAYVRNPRFEVIGVGVKVNNEPAVTYSGSSVKAFITGLDYSDKAILCHNTAFDGAILSWHYGVKPKLWLDTMSMARPLHKATTGVSLMALAEHYKLGAKGTEVIAALGKRKSDFTTQELAQYMDYCANDVELTYKLFKKLKVGFPVSELMVIDQTLRMYTEPKIMLDVSLLEKHRDNVLARKQALLDRLGGADAAKKMLMSNEMFAKLLRSAGVEPPTKISLKTGKESWAFAKTDKAFTDLLEHSNPIVSTLVESRLGVKSTLEETRTKNLIEVAERGALPIMLHYYGAHTGRFSGGDGLNLQNLPSRGNNTIRRALRSPDGYKMVAADSAQIEARLVAYIAQQDDLVQAFREGRDVYSEFASEVYGRKITKADKVERFVGKTCILGLGYGMGAEKFRRTLEIGQGGVNVIIDIEEAKRIVQLYRQKNHKIVGLWNKCGKMLTDMLSGINGELHPAVSYDADGIVLPNKMRIKYAALRKTQNGFEYLTEHRNYQKYMRGEEVGSGKWIRIYGGKAVENLIQALARIVITDQMVKLGRKYHVSFQVHDEIILTVPEAEVEQALPEILSVMAQPPAWASDLPVACEGGAAYNYGDIEK
jgi:DNA polymerase